MYVCMAVQYVSMYCLLFIQRTCTKVGGEPGFLASALLTRGVPVKARALEGRTIQNANQKGLCSSCFDSLPGPSNVV